MFCKRIIIKFPISWSFRPFLVPCCNQRISQGQRLGARHIRDQRVDIGRSAFTLLTFNNRARSWRIAVTLVFNGSRFLNLISLRPSNLSTCFAYMAATLEHTGANLLFKSNYPATKTANLKKHAKYF